MANPWLDCASDAVPAAHKDMQDRSARDILRHGLHSDLATMQQAPDTTRANTADRYALDAMILARCRRPLGHEMKNAVQGLYSGLEILAKAVEGAGRFKVTPLDCLPLLRRQLDGLQETLHRILDDVAPQYGAPIELDVVATVRDLVRFLMSDAAVAGVKIETELPDHATVIAQPATIRKVLLGCFLDAIDAMRGGGRLSIGVKITPQDVTIDCCDTRFAQAAQLEAPVEKPIIDTELLQVVAREWLAEQRGACCLFGDSAEGRTVRISFATTAN